jgi:hypothetical protein
MEIPGETKKPKALATEAHGSTRNIQTTLVSLPMSLFMSRVPHEFRLSSVWFRVIPVRQAKSG